MYFLVEGLPSPRPRLLYTLPLSSPRVRGSFFPMIGVNRSILQRTWGLHELEARRQSMHVNTNAVGQPDAQAEQKRLTYGREFKYDEFIVMPNAIIAVLASIAIAAVLASLTFIPPVGNLVTCICERLLMRFIIQLRWLFKKLAPQPGQGPSDELRHKALATLCGPLKLMSFCTGN